MRWLHTFFLPFHLTGEVSFFCSKAPDEHSSSQQKNSDTALGKEVMHTVGGPPTLFFFETRRITRPHGGSRTAHHFNTLYRTSLKKRVTCSEPPINKSIRRRSHVKKEGVEIKSFNPLAPEIQRKRLLDRRGFSVKRFNASRLFINVTCKINFFFLF